MDEQIPGLDELVSQSAGSGRITAGSIARSLGHLHLTPAQVFEVYRRITEAGAQIEEDPDDPELPDDPADSSIDDYLSHLAEVPPLSDKRERYLLELIQAGGMADEIPARKALLESNQRTVLRVARGREGHQGSLGALLADGNLGLLKALDLYDPGSPYSFGAYATWWVHRAMQQAADQPAARALEPATADVLNRMCRIQAQLRRDRVREPSAGEIAGEMGLTAGEVEELMKIA